MNILNRFLFLFISFLSISYYIIANDDKSVYNCFCTIANGSKNVENTDLKNVVLNINGASNSPNFQKRNIGLPASGRPPYIPLAGSSQYGHYGSVYSKGLHSDPNMVYPE
jgi:hypothetical protein